MVRFLSCDGVHFFLLVSHNSMEHTEYDINIDDGDECVACGGL